jgi:LmbE family N-acetylglucosaminyl deacetylase
MVIVAHPDDAEFIAAGTVARWAREGREITYTVCTNGNKGTDDPTITPEQLAAMRESEQNAAAAVLGVRRVVFLGYNDGELQPTPDLRRSITRVIRRYRPYTVITMDPTVRFFGDDYMNHPDHRAAGDAACDAIFPAARDRLYFPELLAEGLEPHKVKETYLAGTLSPNIWIDIADTLKVKIAALLEHRSQIGDASGAERLVCTWAEEAARGHNLRYAEAFRRITLPD